MADGSPPLPNLHDEAAPTTDAVSALPDATRADGVESPETALVAAGSAEP